jgi:hypothetical protein
MLNFSVIYRQSTGYVVASGCDMSKEFKSIVLGLEDADLRLDIAYLLRVLVHSFGDSCPSGSIGCRCGARHSGHPKPTHNHLLPYVGFLSELSPAPSRARCSGLSAQYSLP